MASTPYVLIFTPMVLNERVREAFIVEKFPSKEAAEKVIENGVKGRLIPEKEAKQFIEDWNKKVIKKADKPA